jgi:hypothetical protein
MTDKLTGILAEIAELVGDVNARLIASRVGGTRVYLPKKASAEHWLVQCVGSDAATKVMDQFGGGEYVVPQAGTGSYSRFRREIASRIHKLDQSDTSSKNIAREVGVTQRTIHRHRLAHRGGNPDDSQGSLL